MIDVRFIVGKQLTRLWKRIYDTVRVRKVEIPVQHLPYNQVYRLRRDMYEQDERNLLPFAVEPDTPVIELGGCFGFIAGMTDRMLCEGVPHVVVEPMQGNIDTLKGVKRLNEADFDIVEKAYSAQYDGVSMEREVDHNPMTNRITGEGETPTVTLKELHERVGGEEFTLISDIETGEQDLFENESGLLEEYCRRMHIEFDDGGEDSVPDIFRPVQKNGDVCVFENRNLIG